MDARLQFEWNNNKAKNIVKVIAGAGFFGPSNEDIVDRDDAEYEVSLTVRLKHKRKTRKKKEDSKQTSIGLDE